MFRSGDLEETYTGGFKNGQKHGQGHLEYREKGNEYDYTGMMEDNKRHGWGYLINIAKGYEFEGHLLYNSNTFFGRTKRSDGKIDEKCLDANIYNNPNMIVTIGSGSGGQHRIPAHMLKCQEFEVIV